MGKTFRHNKWDEEDGIVNRKFIKRKKHTRFVKTERGFEERHNRRELLQEILTNTEKEE